MAPWSEATVWRRSPAPHDGSGTKSPTGYAALALALRPLGRARRCGSPLTAERGRLRVAHGPADPTASAHEHGPRSLENSQLHVPAPPPLPGDPTGAGGSVSSTLRRFQRSHSPPQPLWHLQGSAGREISVGALAAKRIHSRFESSTPAAAAACGESVSLTSM